MGERYWLMEIAILLCLGFLFVSYSQLDRRIDSLNEYKATILENQLSLAKDIEFTLSEIIKLKKETD